MSDDPAGTDRARRKSLGMILLRWPLMTARQSAGGVEHSVTFEPASADVREAVDAPYHAKYDRYGPAPVGAVTGPDVLETTLRVRPR
jgi:hypothetical protein